jgi:large subunit ribosomal protein L23
MRTLIKPVISEKMSALSDKLNNYAFVVDKKANKIEIAKAVEDMYGVTVNDVRTLNVPAKKKSRFTKSGLVTGRKSGYKKAIVTITEGQEIDFYSEI